MRTGDCNLEWFGNNIHEDWAGLSTWQGGELVELVCPGDMGRKMSSPRNEECLQDP